MHINVKKVILAKLIAQYFNLIISETRKNVVKSFPFLVESLSVHPLQEGDPYLPHSPAQSADDFIVDMAAGGWWG